MIFTKRIFSLAKNDKGSTIIEFAAIVPLFFVVFLALFEFGMFMYSRIIVENIAQEVSRVASIGLLGTTECPASINPTVTDNEKRVQLIECTVSKRAGLLINGTNSTIVQMQSLAVNNAGTKIPDICLVDTNNNTLNPPSSTPATCSQYIDVNANGSYEGMQANSSDCGGKNIEIRVVYVWNTLFKLFDHFFVTSGNVVGDTNPPKPKEGLSIISAVTVIKNEPFGGICL